MPEFEWDENKNRQNRRAHRIDFETAALIWQGFVVERPDDRFEYGEDRIITFGAVGDRVLEVTYTWRGEARRLISARKATKDEREAYEEEFRRAHPAPN
jgi:uncharacterized protein